MARKGDTVERRIARIASGAHGVVTTRELLAVGISEDEIRGRVRSGLLIPEFRGVYRAGHRAPSTEARYMAAVKACGDGAVLSGKAAAWLYGLIRGPVPLPDVTCPTNRRVKSVRTHRSRRLQDTDTTTWRRIPITTVPRTLVDLPSVLSFDDLATAVHIADARHNIRPELIEAAIRRYPNAPGAHTLRAIATGDAPTILSELERRFLALLEAHGLPLPNTNCKKDSHYVDCRWPAHRLTVELDSYRFHRTRRSWEDGYQRERDARARGDEFRRYTWKDVDEQPGNMLDDLRRLLNR